MVIAKPEEHDINRAGKRLLRELLEPLGWVVNDVQEDYGIDSNVQVFDGRSPTGAWFHVQLKSSASSDYAANRTFVSQDLSVDHARHYSVEMRQPVLVIHADVTSGIVYWYAPQLDNQLAKSLGKTGVKSVTVRIPTSQHPPRDRAGAVNDLGQDISGVGQSRAYLRLDAVFCGVPETHARSGGVAPSVSEEKRRAEASEDTRAVSAEKARRGSASRSGDLGRPGLHDRS